MKRFKFNEKHMKSNLKKASAIVASVFMGLSAVSVGLSTASAEDTPEAETPSLTENVASNESTTITDGKQLILLLKKLGILRKRQKQNKLQKQLNHQKMFKTQVLTK